MRHAIRSVGLTTALVVLLFVSAGVANADDLNAMDLVAAAIADPRRSDKGWLHALLALLGGALAAASTARYLFG